MTQLQTTLIDFLQLKTLSRRDRFRITGLLLIICAVIICSGRSSAQTPTPSTQSTNPSATVQPAPVNEEPLVTKMKKTVIFIETDCQQISDDGQSRIVPYLGTGFLVQVHDDRYPEIGGFTYLVTNRHVISPGVEDSKPCKVVDQKIRVNLKVAGPNGSLSDAGSIGANAPWVVPEDSSVDLAVVPFGLDQSKIDFLTIPNSLFLSSDAAKASKLVEGDSILFTGLFIQFLGQSKLEPIVREGKIAMLPSEQIPTTLHTLGDVFLVDTHVFGGNSGSPVFVNLAGQRDNGLIAGYDYKLLGIISGYVQESSDLKLQAVAGYAGTVVANSGIAIVVPAQKLIELLQIPSLANQRRDVAASFPKAK